MSFNEFLQRISSMIGPKNAFDLGRDARISALSKLMIKKGLLTKEEVQTSESEEMDIVANKIATMPPLPMQTKIAQ